MNTFKRDSAGHVTHVTSLRIGSEERRHELLRDYRRSIDGLMALRDETQKLADGIRRHWPMRYPVPYDIDMSLKHTDAVIQYCDYSIECARSGSMRRTAEICESVTS